MKITLNGEPRSIAAPTLEALLSECGFSGRVATAVNEAFIPAALRTTTRLSEGDRVEVLAPMQGG